MRHERSRPGNGVFDGVADEAVAWSDNQRNHQNAKSSARAAFPEQNHKRDNQDGKEISVAAGERHHGIEKRIAQRLVDKTQQTEIECLEPMHERSLRTTREMETELQHCAHGIYGIVIAVAGEKSRIVVATADKMSAALFEISVCLFSSANHKRTDFLAFESFAAFQKPELNQKRDFQNFSAEFLHERDGGRGGSARREQIVNQ